MYAASRAYRLAGNRPRTIGSASMARSRIDKARLSRIGSHFQKYIDDGRLPGWQIIIAHDGNTVYEAVAGRRDVEAGLDWTDDTIVRLYSNSKIITAVAALMLWEEGAFELRDPVHAFIPSFRDTRVYKGGNAQSPATVPQHDPMRIWQLFTHTSGLTYGFHRANPVDEIYRNNGFEMGSPDLDLEAICDRLATFPLCFQPGTEWNYSMSTDVLGRVVEVCSGQTLDAFMKARIFDPLAMADAAFHCPEPKHSRLAALYTPTGPGRGGDVRSRIPDHD